VPSFKKRSTPSEAAQSEAPRAVSESGKCEPAGEGYEPNKAFRRDLLRFISPIQTAAELPTFICLLVLLVGWPFLGLFSVCCCLGLFIQLACGGCLCSFFFTIITDTAEGCDELPYFGSFMEALEHPWTQIIVPLTNFIAALLYCILPSMIVASIYSAITNNYKINNQTVQLLLTGLSIGGLFFLPMVALILAYDQINLLLRPVIIFRSIIAIWKPYLIAWIILVMAFGGLAIVYFALPDFKESGLLIKFTLKVMGFVVVQVVWLVFFIYAMRVIGLLYRHFDDRLSWAERSDPKHPLEKD